MTPSDAAGDETASPVRILYHFSEREPWPEIERSGTLEPRWAKGHCRPGVPPTVHLSDSPSPSTLPWALREARPIRFTVELDEGVVHHWPAWGRANVLESAWKSIGVPIEDDPVERLTQWNDTADSWYVVEGPIPVSSWVEVQDLETGQVLWRRGDGGSR